LTSIAVRERSTPLKEAPAPPAIVSVQATPGSKPPVLEPVGPGRGVQHSVAPVTTRDASRDQATVPRWVRPRPTPFVVRWANTLTEGRAYTLILILLLGISGFAGAWALGLAAGDDPNAVVVVSPDPTRVTAPTASPSVAASASQGPREHRYVVRRGDTLREIAHEIYGDEALWTVLLEANRDLIPDPENLVIGTNLLIPNR
jgi:hypothetical protein